MTAGAALTRAAIGEGLIRVPGGRVHWRRFGDGPGLPVLMVHGGPGLTSSYMDSLAGLADGRPVFTWDQLDCGRSDRPHDRRLWLLERFVDELDAVRTALTPGPVHVLGHSWGTTLALEWLATRRPANVASVVFASPCLDVPRWITDMRELIGGLPPEAQAAIAKAERTGCFDTPEYQKVVWEEWMHAHIARSLTPEAIRTMPDALIAARANLELLEFMWGPSDFTVTGPLRTFNRTADLAQLEMPALFHCGEFDEARPETVREQSARAPQGEFVTAPGAGHLTMIDAPDDTNDAIRAFLERVEERRRAAQQP